MLSYSVNSSEVSIIWNEKHGTYELKRGFHKNFSAFATFENSINKTGFAQLEVKTNPNDKDREQAYTAGLIEGLLTSDLIKDHWYNTYADYCKKPLSDYCSRLQHFLDENFKWMYEQIFLHGNGDPLWHQVELILIQLTGLLDGYNFEQRDRSTLGKVPLKPDVTGLLLLFLSGDLSDIETALGGYNDGYKPFDHALGTGSCSAIIKVLPDAKDLLVSQTTWNHYGAMLRILKKYDLSYHTITGGPIVPGRAMTFSSYPGVQFSGDDFYIITSGLVSQETTIGNYNDKLWSLVSPQTLLEAFRHLIANRLSTSGSEWVNYFSNYNSGTYNNQWMVVDYKKFTPGSTKLNDGLLYVLEQIPGMIKSMDATHFLQEQSYWPSYNSPYFPDIFNASGVPELVAKYGDWFTYDKTPRALIFKRDHSNVKDLDTLMKLMRYNDYKNDPLSACNCTPPYSAENAIAARSDLNPANGTYPFESLGHRPHGETDAKLTSFALMQKLQFVAVSGPTYDQVPPFKWSESDFKDTVRHRGHPDLWTFEPIITEWNSD